jgi:hypothetical protein
MASFRYFNHSKFTFTNASGLVLGTFRPYEYTFHLGYARRITRQLSAGINLGYIHSCLAPGYLTNPPLQPGTGFMVDFSMLYNHPVKRSAVFKKYTVGLTIPNLGQKAQILLK